MSYKKIIIHTVKECWEEDAPVTGPEEVTEIYAPTYEAKKKIGNIFTTVNNENTAIGIDLRLDLRDYFTKLLSIVNAYIEVKAYDAGREEAAFLKAELPKQVNYLNEVLRIWFRTDQLPEPAARTTDFFNNLLLTIDSVYAGTAATPDKIATEIDSMSEAFRTFNQFAITPGGLNELWHAYYTTVVNQATAKKTKDWAGEHSAQQLGYRIVVEGQDTGTRSISDIIAIAIIQGQPWRFR